MAKKSSSTRFLKRQILPQTFLGIKKKSSPYKSSDIVILPISYEGTASYGLGTGKGPDAIIEASRYLESYDEECNYELCLNKSIHTHKRLSFSKRTSPRIVTDNIYKAAKKLLNDKKFVCAFGGEHSITIGLVKAFAETNADVSVLQIDAHADLKDSYEGTEYSHACVMRRIRSYCKTVHVGIRSLTKQEQQYAEREKIPIFYGKDIHTDARWISKVLNTLSSNVYVSIDVDGFDPSLIPSTGTPEPGGLTWYTALNLLRTVAQYKNIIGFDIVELSPKKQNKSPDFVCAKLAYKVLTYIHKK